MNPVIHTPCNCKACVGEHCQCACQAAAQPTACKCGPQCGCDAQCACSKG